MTKVEKPSSEETSKMLENGASALKTGIKFIGWGATKIAEKAEEHKVMDKMKDGVIQAKQKADESGLTREVDLAFQQAGKNLKEESIKQGHNAVEAGKTIHEKGKAGTLKEDT